VKSVVTSNSSSLGVGEDVFLRRVEIPQRAPQGAPQRARQGAKGATIAAPQKAKGANKIGDFLKPSAKAEKLLSVFVFFSMRFADAPPYQELSIHLLFLPLKEHVFHQLQ